MTCRRIQLKELCYSEIQSWEWQYANLFVRIIALLYIDRLASSYPSHAGQALATETNKLVAMSATLRRVCTPKPASGKLEVSAEIYKQWKAGGQQRQCLLDMLIKAGGDKDPWVDASKLSKLKSRL